MQLKKQQLELDMEQQTGSKLGKEYVKAVLICRVHIRNAGLDEAEIKIAGRISISSDMQMTPPLW